MLQHFLTTLYSKAKQVAGVEVTGLQAVMFSLGVAHVAFEHTVDLY